jgi:hypothetical protein
LFYQQERNIKKEGDDMAKMAKIHWFFGTLCVLIIIAAAAILGLSSVDTGITLGIAVILISPFVLWWSNNVRKHDDNIHYHEKDMMKHKPHH